MTTDKTSSAPPPVPVHGLAGWMVRVRAPFFTAVLVPITLGAVVAWVRTGTLHIVHFVLTLVAGVLIHAGANLINDYFDHQRGTDVINREAIAPFTGGGPQLRLGLIEPRRARNEALTYFALSGLIGLYLTWRASPWVLALGIIGVVIGYFYTAPQVFLAGTGWGEVSLLLAFGPLMVLGAWVVQTNVLSWEPIWASLPVGCLILNVLWINQFPDAPSDAKVQKRHWVVRLGRQGALPIYGGLFAATYGSLALNVVWGGAPVWTLLGLLTAPLAWQAWRVAQANYDQMPALAPANALTVRVHLLTGVLQIIGYLIQGIVR